MGKNIRNMNSKIRFLFKILFSFALLFVVFLSIQNKIGISVVEANDEVSEEPTQPEYYYLSDLNPTYTKVGWGSFIKDKASDGSLISVKVEGGYYSFGKGLWAHATSEIRYNLTGYDYDYFTAYIGLNKTAASSSNGVIFRIYTSKDGTNWGDPIGGDIIKKPGENATPVRIPISENKYLRLVADSNGSNGNDHSVYADAKLIKSTYKEPGEDEVPQLEELDKKIKSEFENADLATNKDFELTLLKRELINRVGNFALRKFLSASEGNKATYEWLTGDVDNLRLYMLGGTPEGGSYYNSLTRLSELYNAKYIVSSRQDESGKIISTKVSQDSQDSSVKNLRDDFTNSELLNNKWYSDMTYGDLYKKMAITLSLTHSQRVALWMQPGEALNQSDAVNRYLIYKDLHKNGNLIVTKNQDGTPNINITPWFEALQVEEMRFVMNNLIDDEEILWLNEYVQTCIDASPSRAWALLTPHPYMAYIWPNYGKPEFHREDLKSAWDTKFNGIFSKYGVTHSSDSIAGGRKIYKVWMNFRNEYGTGAVCGGISKTGSNIRATHGIPATVIGQPGHAALLYYTKVDDPTNVAYGKGYWNIDNDVSGWTASEKGERMLLGWGNQSFTRGSYQVVYMQLAQEAINDYENLVKSEEIIMLANVYNGDLENQEEIYRKKEEVYREALEIQPINIDAWYNLINIYNVNKSKTEDEFYDLAEELAESLKDFPLPMYQLTNLIKPHLTSVQNTYKFTLLQTRILTEASTHPSTNICQPSLTKLEANFLLGKVDKSIATFSFDGVNAGKLVFSSRFDGNGFRFEYSLDGKQTWKSNNSFTAEEEHKWQLTKEEIASITSINDIYINIEGIPRNDNTIFKIDITEQTLLANLFANDLENRVVGVNLNTEWRYTENDPWISYSVASPDLTGTKTVQVRQSATGTKLTSPASPVYTFTPDNQPDTRKYIPVSHLSIAGVSTQATSNGGAATNAIDANYNTRYHSAWNGTDTERYITIQLDNPVYLSAVEFVPAGGGNGKILAGTVYGSMDGENWEILSQETNFRYTNMADTIEQAIANTKCFEIADPKEVKYVKIKADNASQGHSMAGNGNWFTARAFNLYQNITMNPNPTAGIAYSTTEPTNGIVVARLINPSTEITITSEGGDTHVFAENGEFTFTFVDKDGNAGSATATVTWIDKNGPEADVKYKLDADKKLLILLDDISEDVYLLDSNNIKTNYIEVDDNKKVTNISYLDSNGNTYKTLDIDTNGNITKVTYKNTTNEVNNVSTYVTTLENGIVAGEEYFDEYGTPILDLDDDAKENLRNLQQATSNPLEYIFAVSGDYEFKILDKANNIAYKSIKVDYIDNNTKILASDITYNITKATYKNVIATIKPYIIDTDGSENENVVMVDEKGNIINTNSHTFTNNGQFAFYYKDVLDTQNWEIKNHIARVTWIDKDAPTAKIKYSTESSTKEPVTATLVDESEEIIITNNGTSREHTFTKNGEFTFEFEDKAGNKGTVTAKVTWINKNQGGRRWRLFYFS